MLTSFYEPGRRFLWTQSTACHGRTRHRKLISPHPAMRIEDNLSGYGNNDHHIVVCGSSRQAALSLPTWASVICDLLSKFMLFCNFLNSFSWSGPQKVPDRVPERSLKRSRVFAGCGWWVIVSKMVGVTMWYVAKFWAHQRDLDESYKMSLEHCNKHYSNASP